MNLQTTYLILNLTCLGVFVGCNEKPAPEPPSSSSSSADATKGDENYFGFGANVGSASVLKLLAECNKHGYFFDRLADDGKGACDESQIIADFKCTSYDEAVKAMDIKGVQLEKLDSFLKNDYKDYLFDQCVESSSEFILYLAKQANDKDGTINVNVSHISIVKP